jgi:hypothetical protein
MIDLSNLSKEVPKVKDLMDYENILSILSEAKGLATHATQILFGNSRKIPMPKNIFQRYMEIGCILGEIKAIERMMSWLETTDIVDHFNPNHDLVQFIYGELCMYLLKLDRMLLDNYGIKSSINVKEIEIRTQKYLDRYYYRIEKIKNDSNTN